MKKMPVAIKNKLRKLHRLSCEAKDLEAELIEIFENYGIDTDVLCGLKEDADEGPHCEGLSYVLYGEGYIEDNINLIEEVFLHYQRKQK